MGKLTPAVPAVETFSDLAFGDIFLHLLTGNLALLADEFALDDFCSVLFEGFLLTASTRYPGWVWGVLGGWQRAGACSCGLFQEGECAAAHTAAPAPPAPPCGAIQAAGPAEGTGAHWPGACHPVLTLGHAARWLVPCVCVWTFSK